MIAYLRQRWADFIHEGAIRAAEGELNRLDRPVSDDTWAYVKWSFLQSEIDSLKSQRSPQQLARMKGRGE